MASDNKIRGRKIIKGEMVEIPKENVKNIRDIKEKKTSSKASTEKIKTRKIRMSLTKAEEKKMDKVIEQEDNISILVMVFILCVCFVIGISLGYLLYRIAINGAI